ncbi:MAG: efflux RND transporter periplasmic adaptor subunit [Proteobacteria bacterium]|nr:efflux RND transporter periplasmic adaptor subunit [Pseudomonadota bacterium]MBU4296041.1 efflux RND transporter periplasmic adaptor subunit [Pseudomonadota bacterium]MCG2747292.1 efflux RND transporter periplasmic adaptor subunit [Desulfobulbaceae bacterium]
MKKRIFFAVLGLLILAGVLGGIKALQIRRMIEQKSKFSLPPEVVTTAIVQSDSWGSTLTAVGSLTAVQGVIVSAEVSGKITQIAFTPGTKVQAGDLLIRQDTASEEAQLRAAETSTALAKLNLDRYTGLLAQQNIAQSLFDNAEAQYKEAKAQADSIRAIINKKNIRAPFAGRLGVRLVNLGEILKEDAPIVSLQALDPIFVDFLLPQQHLGQVKKGLPVRIKTDALPGQILEGKITTINPEIDSATRNMHVQATVANEQELLRPGLFVNVEVVMPTQRNVIVIPATAVLYAPYGDSIFVLKETKNEKTGQNENVLNQQFVKLGEKRGDFVAVVSGIKEGETIVSTGAFKLRNGQAAVVNNELAPEFKLAPKPKEN